ncbi:MAG: hypothetical protein K0R11_322 [Acidimicrobiales bacterium]|nr:hypothetical protein [Acidimicrobiales bacterium]
MILERIVRMFVLPPVASTGVWRAPSSVSRVVDYLVSGDRAPRVRNVASGDRGVSGRDWPWYVGAASGLLFLALGVWAMAGPESFFDRVATFEPYNQHFVQDIGAFQIGLGAVLLLAVGVRRPDALTVALLGVGIGSAAHVVSHLIGHDLGGTPETDIPVFSIATALLLGAGVAQWSGAGRGRRR